MTRAEVVAREKHPIKKAVKLLGPGFITGAMFAALASLALTSLGS